MLADADRREVMKAGGARFVASILLGAK
jgi:hypothetical protein